MPYASEVNKKHSFLQIVMFVPILALLLAGCLQRERSVTAGGIPFELNLWVNNRCPNYGEPVTIRASAINRDSRVHIVEFKDHPILDIYVNYRTRDEILIRWSDGKPSSSDLNHVEIKPGESKSIEMQASIPPGAYNVLVSARLYYEGRSVDNPIGTNMSLTPNDCFH